MRDLELEVGGGHRRKDQDNREGRFDNGENHHGARFSRSGSYRHRDHLHSRESRRHRDSSHSRESRQRRNHSCSQEYANRSSDSPEKRRPRNAAMDAISRTLRKAARSPFLDDIERAQRPSRFTRPPFNSYDGKTDPVEHVSHYIQMMSLHTHNDALMCKVFPSNLEPTALRWFNGLRKGSIHSFA